MSTDALALLHVLTPPGSRVRRGRRLGTVDGVAILRGEGVAYVTWDQIIDGEPPIREAVVVSHLRQVTA
ncbi:hypothetical protein [Sphaerimonospora thailandensis]|uniref:Uncharacterized protein n=1 Tax=Sphaerimonospora thailandensis TaxID=795644 RepID=A0A8J3R597_9ACTN|nr:hypothetical protein [Sphaerimonospora thailandensis]GIH69476.1 hypothetical protein Mth01_17290 [Sphaerimonospora thailandensis]